MIATLFVNPELKWSPEGGEPLDFDSFVDALPFADVIRHNVLYWKHARMALDNNAAKFVRMDIESTSNWHMLIVRVVGTAKVTTAGATDWDGVTSITNVVPTYGTALLPGWAILTFTNAASARVTALADGTIVDAFLFVLAADDDTRLTTNA